MYVCMYSVVIFQVSTFCKLLVLVDQFACKYNGTLFLSNFSIQDSLTKTGSKNSKKALRTWFKKSQCCEKLKFFKRETTSDEPALLKRKYGVKKNKDQYLLLFVSCLLFGWENCYAVSKQFEFRVNRNVGFLGGTLLRKSACKLVNIFKHLVRNYWELNLLCIVLPQFATWTSFLQDFVDFSKIGGTFRSALFSILHDSLDFLTI